MRLIVSIAFAAAGFAGLNLPGTSDGASISQAVTRSDTTSYDLQLIGGSDVCRIEKREGRDAALANLKLEPGCLTIYPALSRAKSWQELGDGSLALAASNGEPVVVFAVSDGLAFESIEPASPLITLTSAD